MDSEQSLASIGKLELPQRPEKTASSFPNRKAGRNRLFSREFWKDREFNPKLRMPAAIVGSGMLAVGLGLGANSALNRTENVIQGNQNTPGIKIELPDGMPSASFPIIDVRAAEAAGAQEAPVQKNSYELFNNLSASEKSKLDAEFAGIDTELKDYNIYKNFDQVVHDYDKVITDASLKFNIPKDIIYGMIFIESSGDPEAISPDETAVGIGQFRIEAAQEAGLIIDTDNGIDERKIPEKAIGALANYVDKYRKVFGDNLGIGVGNYHMGPGNMMEAIRVYSIDMYGVDPGDSLNALGKVVRDHNLNLDQIYSNPAVEQQVLSTKEDDTVRYAKKAQVAALEYNRRIGQ